MRLDRWDQKATITERNEVTTEGRHGPLLLLLFIAGQVHAQRIFECMEEFVETARITNDLCVVGIERGYGMEYP